ncbi:hypothetical protein Q7P36_007079 [Cladosporium allicinum]
MPTPPPSNNIPAPSETGSDPTSNWGSRYRGAVVEDLDPGPALSTHPTTPVGQALFSAFERDYTHLTVLDPISKTLLGYISTPSIKAQLQSGSITENDSVEKAMVKFRRKGRKYALITMETPLEDLQAFFEGANGGEKQEFAVVTDPARSDVDIKPESRSTVGMRELGGGHMAVLRGEVQETRLSHLGRSLHSNYWAEVCTQPLCPLVAAGAGFLALAGQVLDSLVNLRGFIATVDSAPREIHDLCLELDDFRGLLEEAGRRVQESLPMGVDPSHLKDAFAHCEKMRAYAESTLKRLEVNINRSKATTALRYPFKKKEIEGMLLGVERGKTSLLLANQSFESSLASRRHVVLSEKHDALLDQQRKIKEEIALVISTTAAVANSQHEKLASITHDVAVSTQTSRVQIRGLEEAYTEGYRQIRTTLSQLQDQSTSISSGVTSQAQQNQRIATSFFNAEHNINEVNARLEALSLQISSQTQIDTTTRTTLSFGLMPLSITWEKTSSRKQRTSTKVRPAVRLLTVRLPKWFLQRQYDLQLLRATSGWPFTLRACRIVRFDSPFFIACQTGDIETIKVLLSNKQASIYYRTTYGITAFAAAISCGQLEVCKLLRHAGILAQFDYNDYDNVVANLGFYLNDFTEHELSLLRVAAPSNDPDRDWSREYCQFSHEDGTAAFQVEVELFDLLNSAPSDTAISNLSHLRSYFDFRTRAPDIGGYHSFMPYIARVLSKISIVSEITAARGKYAWILYGLASEISRSYNGGNPDSDRWLHSARQALCAVVRAGLNPHQNGQTSGMLESPYAVVEGYQNLSMTPLGLLCVESLQVVLYSLCWRRYRDQSSLNNVANVQLQAWLSGLHSAGIDLLQYAESESAYYGGAPDLLAIPLATGGIITVSTGPRPEDWHFSLWERGESYAGMFWRLIEGNPLFPGLTTRIIEASPLSASQNPTSRDLPGSWPSEEARVAEELESWLLGSPDDELAQIEEDLSLLNEWDFFTKWSSINRILPASIVVISAAKKEHEIHLPSFRLKFHRPPYFAGTEKTTLLDPPTTDSDRPGLANRVRCYFLFFSFHRREPGSQI